jgi:hypothetical protein
MDHGYPVAVFVLIGAVSLLAIATIASVRRRPKIVTPT